MCIIRLRKTNGPPGKGYTLKRMMGGIGRKSQVLLASVTAIRDCIT